MYLFLFLLEIKGIDFFQRITEVISLSKQFDKLTGGAISPGGIFSYLK
jgi:hypothetical protein